MFIKQMLVLIVIVIVHMVYYYGRNILIYSIHDVSIFSPNKPVGSISGISLEWGMS